MHMCVCALDEWMNEQYVYTYVRVCVRWLRARVRVREQAGRQVARFGYWLQYTC